MEDTTEIIANTAEEIEGNPVVSLIVVGTFTALAAVGAYQVGLKIGNAVGNFVVKRRMDKAEAILTIPQELGN